eukprot:scaffold422985_cov54-Attheya_sp.AAC.2
MEMRKLECASGKDPPDRHVVDVFHSIRVVRNPPRAIDPTDRSHSNHWPWAVARHHTLYPIIAMAKLLLGYNPTAAENPWWIGGYNPIALDIRPNKHVDGLASEHHVVSLSALVPIATTDNPSICPTKEEGCSDRSAWYGGRNNRRVIGLVQAGRTARNERVHPSVHRLQKPNIPPPPIHPQERRSIIPLHPTNSTTPFPFDTDNSFPYLVRKDKPRCVIWDLSTNHIIGTCHGFHLLTPKGSASQSCVIILGTIYLFHVPAGSLEKVKEPTTAHFGVILTQKKLKCRTKPTTENWKPASRARYYTKLYWLSIIKQVSR